MAVEAPSLDLKRVTRPGLGQRLSILPFVLFLVVYLVVARRAGDRELTTLIYIGINVILALGLNLLMGYAGQISLGHAAFFGMGAYISAILTVRPVQDECIPGIALGLGVIAGIAAVLSIAKPAGWKLLAAVGGLAALVIVKSTTGLPLVWSIVMFTVVMVVLGAVCRSGWLGFGFGGLVSSIVIGMTESFLDRTLANGGASPWTGMVVGMVVTGLVAYLIGGQVLRLKGHYLAMATLAFGMIIEIVFSKWTAVTGGSSDGIFGIPTINVMASVPGFVQSIMRWAVGGPVDERRQYYFLVWGFVFFALVIASNIVRSRVGRAFRAVHGSELAAESLGVDTDRYKVQVFVLSAALASLAGSLYAHNAGIGYINPSEFNFMTSVQLVVMVVVGGMASVWGSLFGAGVIQLLKDWLLTLDQANKHLLGLTLRGLDPIVFGAVLILVMVILPSGLVRGLTDLGPALVRVVSRRKPRDK